MAQLNNKERIVDKHGDTVSRSGRDRESRRQKILSHNNNTLYMRMCSESNLYTSPDSGLTQVLTRT